MTTTHTGESFAVLEEVADAAGLSADGAEPIRLAENDLWKLSNDVVVRIARPGQDEVAAREVASRDGSPRTTSPLCGHCTENSPSTYVVARQPSGNFFLRTGKEPRLNWRRSCDGCTNCPGRRSPSDS